MLIDEEFGEDETIEIAEEGEEAEEEPVGLDSARIDYLEKFVAVTMLWEKILANQAKIEDLEALIESIVTAPTPSKEKVEEKKVEKKAKKKTSKRKTKKKSKRTVKRESKKKKS